MREAFSRWFERFYVQIWRWSLRICQFFWPIHVHHYWTDGSAQIILRLPKASPKVSMRMFQITDPHISEEPLEREERGYAERMHGAFRSATNIFNGSAIQPISMFRDLVDLARYAGTDVVALTGDVVNFPRPSTASWVVQTLNGSLKRRGASQEVEQIPYVYCAGNHDWFYEGEEASQWDLRRRHREHGLLPLYRHSALWDGQFEQGGSSSSTSGGLDYGSREMNGVLVISIDNSIQQVTAEQLSFFRREVLRWIPTVLLLHVPLSVTPELRPFNGFALCGDPAWGEATDRSWRDERRAPWPKTSSRETKLFLEAVLDAAAPSGPLVAVLAGHVHAHAETPFGRGNPTVEGSRATGAVQYIGLPAFQGGFRVIDFESLDPEEATVVEKEENIKASDKIASDEGESSQASHQAGERSLVDLLQVRWQSSEVLDGIAHALVAGPRPVAPLCWRRAPTRGVGVLDVRWVEAAVDTMLGRTLASMRAGFRELSLALRPLADHFNQDACGARARDVLVKALQEWDDPVQLSYEPGRRLAFSGRSVLESVNKAIYAMKRDRDWGAFGQHFGEAMWVTTGIDATYDFY